MLLKIEFTTVHDYLRDLEMISRIIYKHNLKSITYLAAAVSDFYIPESEIQEHKIQSGSAKESGFKLEMKAVPKMLGTIKSEWNPLTFLISFKLETDIEILKQKATASFEKYGVDMVVANELKTRRNQVIIYHSDGKENVLKME